MPTKMSSTILFYDRLDAAMQLSRAILRELGDPKDFDEDRLPIVYALPRGGIPLAAIIAERLGCPLDILVAKKITTPSNRELAIGAVTEKGTTLWAEPRFFATLSVNSLKEASARALEKAKILAACFAPYRPQNLDRSDRIAIVIDDGIATGLTVKVAVEQLKQDRAREIWICAPVAPADLVPHLQQWVDRAILVATPTSFSSVSCFYQHFPQISTSEAIEYLKKANER